MPRRVADDALARAEKAERALAAAEKEKEKAAASAGAAAGGSADASGPLATAAAKRAAAAEGFAAELAGKLEASEKRNRELQWQVSMLAAPKELEAGPAGEPPRGPANWLAGAIKGCVAPRPGRARIG